MKIITLIVTVVLSLLVVWNYIPIEWIPAPSVRLTGAKEDFTTVRGKQYKDVIVTRVEPDGIVVKSKAGILELYFVELPKEVQERFHYNPKRAAAYVRQQAAGEEIYNSQQEEIRRQQDEEYARNYAAYLQQQAINRTAQANADQAFVNQQNAALQGANRANQSYSSHNPQEYTTVLHFLPAVPAQHK